MVCSNLFIFWWLWFENFSGGSEMREKLIELVQELSEQQCDYTYHLLFELFIKDRSQ